MRKITPVIFLASILVAHTQLVSARGPGGGGGGASHFGGPAPSSQAGTNSNGRFSSDRATGLDRAGDRMSDEGKTHEKATDAVKTRQKGSDSGDKRATRPATK